MATSKDFMNYVTAQFQNVGEISAKYIFGEYGVYADGKIFAFLCDNQLFIKPTKEGREFIGTPNEAPAYAGAKNSFLISDKLDDREWLSELVRITLKALPEPKPKKKKK